MKKARRSRSNGLRPEYDFASLKSGVRGKYAKRLREGTNLVLLDEDVASAFHSAESVNETLRAVLRVAAGLPRRRRAHARRPRSTRRRPSAPRTPRR